MQSSIQYRPKTLDGLIGQQQLAKSLRGAVAKGKLPHAFLLTGPKGSGKTTVALILALALQCTHQKVFGSPCKVCRLNKAKFPIYELDCGKVRGVDDLEQFISTADYDIVGSGKHKIFILDEAHRLSPTAQDVLLKPFERADKNIWIICSTRPDRIVETLRSRCRIFPLKPLTREGIEQLVDILLTKEKSKLSRADLADALSDKGVTSGRLIANAVDAYISGDPPEEAAEVEGAIAISSKALIRATIKGDWADAATILKKAPASDVRLLRASIIRYLGTVLLESTEVDSRSTTIAKAIKRLAYINQAEESIQLDALAAEVLTLCYLFAKHSL